jgi:hypothetical protein
LARLLARRAAREWYNHLVVGVDFRAVEPDRPHFQHAHLARHRGRFCLFQLPPEVWWRSTFVAILLES